MLTRTCCSACRACCRSRSARGAEVRQNDLPPGTAGMAFNADSAAMIALIQSGTVPVKIDTLASNVRPEVQLKAILEIARNLLRERRIVHVAPEILDSLVDLFPQAERLFLMLLDPVSKWLVRMAFKYRPSSRTPFGGAIPADEIPLRISRSLIDHVLGQKKAVLSQDAGNVENLPTTASIADLKIRSVMCVPLLFPDGEPLGILQVDTCDRKHFLPDDLDILAAVASQVAIAVHNASMPELRRERDRMERDLNQVAHVRKRSVRQLVPVVPGFEFFAHYQPTIEVGGDYYDFVALPQGRIAVALGDVSNKGIAAVLMMANVWAELRRCIRTEHAPAAAATVLNQLLFRVAHRQEVQHPEPQRPRHRAAAARVLLRRPLPPAGPPAGGEPSRNWATPSPACLWGPCPTGSTSRPRPRSNPGDVVVAYSDGVTDGRNVREEVYESLVHRRLLKRLADSPGKPESVGRSILLDIGEFSTGCDQVDDITLICFGPT